VVQHLYFISSLHVYVLQKPNVLDSSSSSSTSSSSEQQRLPMTGTTEQIGTDIDQIKAMGVEHIMFGHVFSPIAKDMNKMIEITKQLTRFAR
jgi:hypothetical protein